MDYFQERYKAEFLITSRTGCSEAAAVKLVNETAIELDLDTQTGKSSLYHFLDTIPGMKFIGKEHVG
ncbi:hypothetical protein D3C76_1869390 [compost metagenome]